MYWDIVDRNLGVIGKEEQQKLKDSCVVIAGCGGMGGIVAAWLARNGIGRLKIADNQLFDVSNINRQFAARLSSIGKNKAEETFKEIKRITNYTEIEVFPGGVTAKNAEEFVKGADIVCDEIEFFELEARIILHQAARKAGIKTLNCNVVGWGTRFFLFTPNSMTMEEFLGVEKNSQLTEELVIRIVQRLAPDLPRDIKNEILQDWVLKKHKAPIFGGTPLISAGILIVRLVLELIGYKNRPWVSELPQMPAYGLFDASRFVSYIKVGRWW